METKNDVHMVSIYNREKIDISKAVEIISSTMTEIYVKLEKEILHITGSELKIIKLNPDDKTVCVAGKINGLSYQDKMSKKSLFGKVFK